jgi:hypothetical protein
MSHVKVLYSGGVMRPGCFGKVTRNVVRSAPAICSRRGQRQQLPGSPSIPGFTFEPVSEKAIAPSSSSRAPMRWYPSTSSAQ